MKAKAFPLAIGIFLLLLAGCRGGREGRGITLAGSTSVEPFAELLAEKYMAENSQSPPINVQGGGSSAGIQAAQSGGAEIGMSSRWLKEDERGLETILIARDAIAIIVHPSNPLSDLTLNQVREIFTGRIENWASLGGSDRPITVVTREEGSGTRGAIEELVMGGERITPAALRQDSNGAVRVIVAGDLGGIGYISLGIVDERVKPLKVEGVFPSQETVSRGAYGLVRPFLFVVKKEPQGLAKEFIEYVLSPQGQEILEEEGLVRAE
ncbi:MAG: phosphate ABC transporter substrate-binding protein [Anaerolineae bacterium]|nr:phosphate ABC transporter substrate-binding protein [Anaerolineae bacterium]